METQISIQTVPITELTLDPHNARKHSQKNIDAIARSLDRFGQRRPLVVHAGVVIAGNGTLTAAKTLGWTDIAITAVPDEWDDNTAKAYALADNRSAELAEWDTQALIEVLEGLDEELIEASGFADIDLDELLRSDSLPLISEDRKPGEDLPAELREDEEEEQEVNRGELLKLADLGWDEPKTETHKGQHWVLGHHHLFIVDINRDHEFYVPFLTAGTIFAPYPNPYVTGTLTARETPFVLVQPRPILAAHLIDKFKSIFPDAVVEMITE